MDGAVLVRDVTAAIVEAMVVERYSPRTVAGTEMCLRELERFCDARGGRYTRSWGAQFAADSTDVRTGRPLGRPRQLRCRVVQLADGFVESGTVGFSARKRPGPSPASGDMRCVLAGWEEHLRAAGLAEGTVSGYVSYARRFLLCLEAGGASRVADVDGGSVDVFLQQLSATCAPRTLHAAANAVGLFARFAGRLDLADGFGQAKVGRKRSPLPVLSDTEAEEIAAACRRAGPRDAAMVALALTTGLRGCDIAGLRLEDIDWRGARIEITQRKTGNPLRLPLTPAAGNAISRYLVEERPTTADRHVFIRSVAPYAGLAGNGSVWHAMKKVFADAGVATGEVGVRRARHTLASRLLAVKVARPVISGVLGHSDPDSADAYIEIDAARMLCCVLPLPQVVAP